MEQTTDWYRQLLNAIPLMIFVVDEDVRIRDLNDAAVALFGGDKRPVLNQRGGEALHCLHATDVPEGCGRGPFCQTCVIRNSVKSSFQGNKVTRRQTRVELQQGETTKKFQLLITASPMPAGNESLTLLILEDISEVSTLREIIPICTMCKKIRDDQQYWQSVEGYFASYFGMDFSHGMCPACMQRYYPDLAGKTKDQPDLEAQADSATVKMTAVGL